MSESLEKTVARLSSGAIDMHLHIGPESRLTRRQDAIEVASTARDVGLKAIVLKNREYGTAALAALVQKLVPEVRVLGSFTLDNEAGGLNPGAVLAWLRLGAKVIWMPTATAANSKDKVRRARGLDLPGEGQSILDRQGNLLAEVKEIMRLVKEYDAVLATGHLSPRETFALVKEAIGAGLRKVVVTHVLQPQLMDEILSPVEIVRLAEMGAIIEYSYWTCQNNIEKLPPAQLAASIRQVGARCAIMTTDFGQIDNPPAPEGLRIFIRVMLAEGIPERDIEVMVKKNPARLLGLE